MFENFIIQEPLQDMEPGVITVTPEGAVSFDDGTSSTFASTEVSSNPRVREDFNTVDILFIGGLAIFGIAGSYANSRWR